MAVATNLKLILVLALIGLALSGYLLFLKYSKAKSFCDLSPELSCDAVQASPYAEFPANSGIPIAGLGIIAFLVYVIAAALLLKSRTFGLRAATAHLLLALWGVLGLLFYVYLTYLELYVIYSICLLCVVTFLITIAILALNLLNWRSVRRSA